MISCKTLNIFVSANTAWLDRAFWDNEKSIGLTDRQPESVFIGFDLAATRDLMQCARLNDTGN